MARPTVWTLERYHALTMAAIELMHSGEAKSLNDAARILAGFKICGSRYSADTLMTRLNEKKNPACPYQ